MASSLVIPSDSPSIYDSLSTLDSQAIVQPNNPPPGIAGFLFDIPQDERVRLESRITDYFVEDNTTIQDNIALLPETFTVKGLIAEIIGFDPNSNSGTPQATIPDALPPNPTMTPVFTPQATQIQAQNAQAANATSTTVQQSTSLYDYYLNKSPQPPKVTRQSSVFGYFYQLWKGRALFSVQTPWGIFNNMAILSIDALQEEDSIYKSNFTITFKKIRIAGDATVVTGNLAGRAVAQALAPAPVNQGIAGQATTTTTQAAAAYNPFPRS